ncbi:Esterase/lipase/thioesterase, active SitE (plasmid) [Neorhizobium galegae bv. officinalis bv. officinalis str. HAMBI 1141]|uniref:Esterase/lipase/thioesterase, active SitE n=2 Tax=Neorhizobium galegae TaxID=399 RepID=A0A068TGF8_NEOGA|nr:Esterase/lipase/thioesterase, active SitE [Neorhizobium galegae bv. officinalis bv. officinalis str. HAMBI 1141]
MHFFPSIYACRTRYGLVVLAVMIGLTGCASRPSAEVLHPAAIKQVESEKVTLLSVTNRNKVKEDGGFGSQWAGDLTYERYGFSVPSERTGSAIVYPSKTPDARRQFVVTRRDQLTRKAWIDDATRSANFDGTVAVFVHGYNTNYQEALFRAAQMAADAKTLSPPILFSWPSAASVTGYVTDRDATLYSRSELESVLIALGETPKIKRVVLFGHSMGGFLSMEAARQLKLQGRDDVVGKLQIILAAPDIDVDVFRSQLRDIGPLPNPVALLVSKTDRALAVSSFLGGERPRVGLIDIDDPLVRSEIKAAHVSVIDISSVSSSDGLGHDRYAALARFGGELVKAEARARTSGDVGVLVFDAAGAAVASPFRLAGQIARQ